MLDLRYSFRSGMYCSCVFLWPCSRGAAWRCGFEFRGVDFNWDVGSEVSAGGRKCAACTNADVWYCSGGGMGKGLVDTVG